MDDLKLESWQRVTIEALVERRSRVAEQANKTVNDINAALKRYTEEWANRQEGPFEFDGRPDGLYLVVKDETELAPAD